MIRNLDLTALRSFVAVAETGGVTRAAERLHLTQSAVSMQIKRLEELLGVQLLDRVGRGVSLTAAGEQLASGGRRILSINDDTVARLTDDSMKGEIVLGVPHDIVYPHVPRVLQRFHIAYPQVRVQLVSSYTRNLKRRFASGEPDIILTTEDGLDPGGETLEISPLVWVGVPQGTAWRSRPLRLAFENHCIFRAPTLAALNRAGLEWEMAVNSDDTRTVEATVAADLAVQVALAPMIPLHLEQIRHGGQLPDLPQFRINLYAGGSGAGPQAKLIGALSGMLREAFVPNAARAAE
ncbi:MAG: LysR family transcriptional regulator [Pseudomonadota bacterium]